MTHPPARIRLLALVLGLLLVALARAAAAPAPAYPLVEAVECHPRAGLPNFFAKLAAGKEVRIGYLGGSITAQEGWRPKTLKWFQDQHPQARISQINAAIGGTGSDLGVFRLQRDVLDQKPDLLFVEFAVNDAGTPPADLTRCMEGIVRQTWKADPATDICFVYTATAGMIPTLQQGKFPQAASVMEKLAEHYAIPTIHLALEVAQLEKEGKLVLTAKPKTDAEKEALKDKIVFSDDGVHPHPATGHELYLKAIVRSMPAIKAAGQPGPHALTAPLAADNWERAKMVPLSALKPAPGAGWQQLADTDPMAKPWLKRMPEVWKTNQPGTTLAFKFKGSAAAVYDLLGPNCGQVLVSIDGQPAALRPRFDRYCTYHRLATLSLARGLPDAVHTVKITLSPDEPDKVKIFADGKQTDENPKDNPKYRGINWYAGAVLVVGDVVE